MDEKEIQKRIQQVEELDKKNLSKQTDLNILNTTIVNRNSYLASIKDQINNANDEKRTINLELNSLKNEALKIKVDHDSKRQEMATWEKNKRAEIFRIEQATIDKANDANKLLHITLAEVDQLNATKVHLGNDITNLKKEIASLDQEVKEISTRSMKVKAEERSLEEAKKNLEKDYADYYANQKAFFKQKEDLETERAAFHAFVLDTKDLENKMQYEKGRLAGIAEQLKFDKEFNNNKNKELTQREQNILIKESNATTRLDAAKQKEKKFEQREFDVSYRENKVAKRERRVRMEAEMKEE